MKGIENVSLVKVQSNDIWWSTVYLIVGGVKIGFSDADMFERLALDLGKARLVDNEALSHFTAKTLIAPVGGWPSDKYFDCGQDGYVFPAGNYYWNCHTSASIVRKNVLVAGWLMRHSTDSLDVPYVNVPYEPSCGVEDVHYNLTLDAVFLDRMYGLNGLSTALSNAVWRGNVPEGDPAAFPIPFATVPSEEPGGPMGADFNSWILPNNDYDLHGELNAWHTQDSGQEFSRHFKGRGPHPEGWVNPLPQDTDAWFPFHPLDPEGTGQPLREGDYVLMWGTLWEDHYHDGHTTWNTGLTYGHDGWLEMHPIDLIWRIRPPGPNVRLTSARQAPAPPVTQIPSFNIPPDFRPSSPTRVLRVRSVQELIDTRLTSGVTYKTEKTSSTDCFNQTPGHDCVKVDITIDPTGAEQARFKASWLVGWSEIDLTDQVWVDDHPPIGVTLYGDGEAWNWTADNVFFGQFAHSSALASGMHQHYFLPPLFHLEPSPILRITSAHDILFTMVYLDPNSPPDEVMLQWHTTDWLSRAYWGENLINWGTNGSADRFYMGPLPPTREWVRLEVPAGLVGLGGGTPQAPTIVDGMAFTLFNGRAIWDYAGVTPSFPDK